MNWRFGWVCALVAVLLAGCATTESETTVSTMDATGSTAEAVTVQVEPLETAPAVMAPPQVPAVLNSVEFVTADLVDRLAVTNTTYERMPSQAFKVVCTLRNLTDEPLRLQARTQYFAEDRMSQEGPGAWQLVFLPPNGMDTYTSYSYGTNLSFYYIEVQEM
ncbi:MAG: hypothetical protein HYV26_02210 [Candidatus Hydrogenedentes bacterium]|nr:hypothetical protein [Candidatus Hydrogenedentota bacterium]